MKKDTMECPYCGEEILAVAKKCKHCGEWLKEDKVNNECIDEEEANVDEEDDDDSYFTKSENAVWDMLKDYWLIIFLLVIAFFTLPSEKKQTAKMMDELRVLVRKEIKKEVRNENLFTQAIGEAAMKNNDLLDNVIKKRYAVKVTNLMVASIITVKEKDTGDENVCGIAAFGFVYTTTLLLGK